MIRARGGGQEPSTIDRRPWRGEVVSCCSPLIFFWEGGGGTVQISCSGGPSPPLGVAGGGATVSFLLRVPAGWWGGCAFSQGVVVRGLPVGACALLIGCGVGAPYGRRGYSRWVQVVALPVAIVWF